jgi:hypothetical protein
MKMSESKGVAPQLVSIAASIALVCGMFAPHPVFAGNNYPPVDVKDTTRCEVSGL